MDSVPGSHSDRSVAKPVAADTSLSLPLPHTSYAPQYAAAYQSPGPYANPSQFPKHPVNPIPTSAPSLAQRGQLPQPQAQPTPARLPAVGPPPTQRPDIMYGNAASAGDASARQQQGTPMSRAPGSTSPMNRQHVMPQSFAPLHPHNQSANPPSLSHRPAKRPPPRSQTFSQQPLSLPHADQFQNHPFSISHNQRPRTQDGRDGAKQRRLQYPQHTPMSSDQPHFTPGRPGSVHSEPFPNSKSLPYPIPPYPPSPSRAEPASRPFATSLSAPLPGISSHTSSLPAGAMPTISPLNSSNNFFLYDIGKLHQSRCTVIAGKVYNDKGHSICGVLNQHDKPCKRIGKCPFHGTATSVSASNSCNGIVDESGTAVRSPGVPDDVSSPPISGGTVPSDLSGLRGSSLSALNSRPTVPPKKLQYKHGWTKEEHFLFLHGLEMHSKGSWKQIAAVVRSRTPTQVQSHAQKYFLRQKQYNKNKRSIHDLTMDAPEMRDLQKRFRNGEFKSGKTNTGANGNLHNPTQGADGLGRSRDPNVLGLQQPMSHPPVSFAQNDGLPGAVTDSNMPRFGNVGNTIVPRFGPGQAVSATTLGSSMSSGVRVPQGNGAYPQRPSFQNGSNFLQQPDILGHASNATVTSTAKGMVDGASDRQSADMAPQARDVTLTGGRSTFGQDAYNNAGQHAPGAPLESPRLLQLQKSEAMISPTAMDKNAEGHAANMTTQPPYSASGFPNLYAQANGHAVFSQSQQRVATEGQQFTWPCETEMKSRRTKGFLQGGRESIQLNGSFGAMGPLSMSEGFANVTVSGLGNQDQMESSFDGGGNHQPSAFAAGIFGNGEAIDVHDAAHGYGVHGSTQGGVHPGTSAQARDVSAVMNGFGGPNGLGLGGLPLRGQGSLSNAPFARN